MIVVNLNEAILPRLAWWILRRRKIVVLTVGALFPPFNGALIWLAKGLDRAGLAPDAAREFPELRSFREAAAPELTLDIFHKVEPWLNDRYGFATTAPALGEYGYAYKHATCNFIRTRLALPVTIRMIRARRESQETLFAGFDRDTVELHRAFYGDDEGDGPRFVSVRRMARPINFLLFVATALTIVCFVLSRLRVSPPAPETVGLGADFIGDSRDRPIYDLSQGGPALLVPRNQTIWKRHAAEFSNYRTAPLRSGVFGLGAGIRAAGGALRDAAMLHRHCRKLAPDHYLGVVRLAHIRTVYRALFNRYRFRNYWCRDDYNAEHIVRSQELRRIGGKSLGLNHGYPVFCPILPQYRYIDYDVYFIFGRHLYERYYKETWPRHMTVRATGSFARSGALIQASGPNRTKDILIFLKVGYWLHDVDDMLAELVTDVASAFPDRRVIVKFKSYRRGAGSIPAMTERWATFENIVVAPEGQNSYALFSGASYALSDPSSIVAEAVHFGLIGFVLDFPAWETLVFRDFPDFCIRNGKHAVERIRSIEAGQWTYPRTSLEALIAMPKAPFEELVGDELA